MSPGVSFVGKVKPLKGEAEGKPSAKCATESAGLDPKTGDLSMGRVKGM
jgi:hypothetical protein